MSYMLVTSITMVWSEKMVFCKIAILVLLMVLAECVESNLVPQDIVETEDTIACPHNCERNVSDNDTDICNHTTGECLLGCKEGFIGPNCTINCSDKESNCRLCATNSYSGAFVCTQCKRNFYRDSGKCLVCSYWCNYSRPLAICNERDGYCEYGCKSGRYGVKCDRRCSSICKDICHRDTGSCLNGCKFLGYCGPTCQLPCQDGCVMQQCNQSCVCVKGCKSNYWGDQCQNTCSSNCNSSSTSSSSKCDTADGSCKSGCQNTFWGSQCSNICSPYCWKGTCHQMSGNCSAGCLNQQMYGGDCSIPCNQNCENRTCHRQNGHCQLGCRAGWYGELCNNPCHHNCYNNSCNKYDGTCVYGCKTGWYGEMCDKSCSNNCYNNKCNNSDGTCVYGCKTGWYGDQCGKQCSDRCLDKKCDVDTGNCSRGCAPGYNGAQCEKDIQTQKVCFGCTDMSSQQFCDSLVHCQANEICFIESHQVAHGKKFYSGCMDEKKCRMVEDANTTSICVECCHQNMCNNKGCGNTDFPSREHRGPMCFDCLHTGDPQTCDTVSMCTPNQVCSIEKLQWGVGFHYKQGCANQVCNSLSDHKRSIPLCHSCCQEDYCNRNCTSNSSNNGEIFVG